MYSLSRIYGFSIFPDEFGYWSYAAKVAGYDWSDIVSMGSYYSYGYSLILIPIFMLIEDAVTAYRIAVIVNFALLAFAFLVLIKLSEKLLGENVESTKLVIFAAIAVFYPSWLFYAQMTLTEIVLMAMYVFICALLYDYVENKRLPILILFILVLVYIYMVHMRSVAVVIAGVMALGYYFFSEKVNWKLVLGVLAVGAVLLLGAVFIKNAVSGVLYADAQMDSYQVNDYGGQIGKLRYILTPEGLKDFCVSLGGKLLYMGMATYGTAYWGIGHIIGCLWRDRRDKAERRSARSVLYIFVLLATVGQLLISTIYTVIPVRIDSITYGRYHEFTFPILMIIGMSAMLNAKRIWSSTVIIILSQLPIIPMVIYSIGKYQLVAFQGYFMVGMSYAHGIFGYQHDTYYWMAYGVGVVLTLLVTGGVAMTRRKYVLEPVLILALVIELALAIRSCAIYSDIYNGRAYQDKQLMAKLEQLASEDRDIVYIDDGGMPIIGILQFMKRDADIRIIPQKASIEEYSVEELDENDLLIVDIVSGFREQLDERYDREYSVGHFSLYYND